MRPSNPSERFAKHYDVVVVGARCAGAATAMLLARRGLRVLAVDQGPYGSDTLSTHALMRAGVQQLTRWGLLERIVDAGTPAITNVAFSYGEQRIRVPLEPRDGVGALYAPRRFVLDAVLCDAAREAGAEVYHGVRLLRLLRGVDGAVSGAVLQTQRAGSIEVGCGLVIGADGRHSRVARLVDAPVYNAGLHASACIYGYFQELPDCPEDTYQWLYGVGDGVGIGAGVIPTGERQHCVFVGTAAERVEQELRFDLPVAFETLLRKCAPQLRDGVRASRAASSLRAFAGQPGYFRRSHGRGWALVGDAGYFKDPLTAHGISDALRDAELLADAVCEGSPRALAAYEAKRDALSRRFFQLTETVASCDWDLESLQALHVEMSKEMSRECRALSALHGPPRAELAQGGAARPLAEVSLGTNPNL